MKKNKEDDLQARQKNTVKLFLGVSSVHFQGQPGQFQGLPLYANKAKGCYGKKNKKKNKDIKIGENLSPIAMTTPTPELFAHSHSTF